MKVNDTFRHSGFLQSNVIRNINQFFIYYFYILCRAGEESMYSPEEKYIKIYLKLNFFVYIRKIGVNV